MTELKEVNCNIFFTRNKQLKYQDSMNIKRGVRMIPKWSISR